MFKKYVTFSFDDGIEQDKRLIALMRKYGLRGTFNISAGLTGKRQLVAGIGSFGFMETSDDVKRNRHMSYVPQYRLPEDELAQVYEGFEVASHAYRHEPLGLISKEKMQESVDLDLANLERIFGYRIYGHAYAKGMGSKATQEYLKSKGVEYARGIKSSNGFAFPDNPWNLLPTCSHISKNVFDLIDTFLKTEPESDDMLLYIWGHGYECDYNLKEASWEKTERIFAKLAEAPGLTYCTNLEAFRAHAASVKHEGGKDNGK